jgi:hypothetical protein
MESVVNQIVFGLVGIALCGMYLTSGTPRVEEKWVGAAALPIPETVTHTAESATMPIECPWTPVTDRMACYIRLAQEECDRTHNEWKCKYVGKLMAEAPGKVAYEERIASLVTSAQVKARKDVIKASQTYAVVEYPQVWKWAVVRYTGSEASAERSKIMGMYQTRNEAELALQKLQN